MKHSSASMISFQKQILECLSNDGTIQDLLEIAHSIFQRPMFIKGDGSTIYAITKNYSSDVHPSWDLFLRNVETKSAEFSSVRTVSEDPDFARVFTKKEASVLKSPSYGGMVLHSNVWLNDKRVCEIIVLENGIPFSDDEREFMDLFSSFIKLHISIHRDRFISNADIMPILIALLDDHSVTPMELLNINNVTGWNVDDEFAVSAASTSDNQETPLLAVFRDRMKKLFLNSVSFIFHNYVVSLINVTRSGGYASVCKQINKLVLTESLHCGLSFEFTGIERTREFYNLALLACSITEKLDMKFLDMYRAAHIRITERIHAITDLHPLIHPDLIRLDRLDPQRTSHYLETLYAYLICGGNYTDTANYLGLHRNSLIYRMNKIQSIVKSDLNDIHNKHFLLISYLLMGISF